MKRNITPAVSPQARQEAAEWFVLLRDGEADCATRESFHGWLRKSPENVHAYLRITVLWEDSELLATSDLLDREVLLRKAAHSSGDVVEFEPASAMTRRESERRSFPRRVRLLAVAASLAIAVAAVTWSQFIKDTYTSGIGEQRTLALSDGSTIVLNARSRVHIHFTRDERGVDLLAGQAIFRVAHNPARPFIVRAGRTNVRAVGTQFDVYRKAASTQVTVIEGRVAVGLTTPPMGSNEWPERSRAAPGKQRKPVEPEGGSVQPEMPARPASLQAGGGGEILLAAGQQLTVAPNASLAPRQADIEAATAWTQGKLIFNQTPLGEVVSEFNRYNIKRLIVDDPDLGSFHVSGIFPSNDPMRVAELLRERFNVTVRQTDDEIRIVRP